MSPIKDTAANFIANNPKLYLDQYGIETDTGLVKLGDGINLWNDLTHYSFPMEYGEATGTDAYSLNFGLGKLLAYYKGLKIIVKFANANTGASTLNVNSLGAVPLKMNVSTALAAGGIAAGGIYILVYDGTNFQIGNSITAAVIPPSFGYAQTEVDFGSTPIAEQTFTIADANAIVGSKIFATLAYDTPTGKDLDELEMDSLVIIGGNAGVGTFQLYIKSVDGTYLEGKFKINYKIV